MSVRSALPLTLVAAIPLIGCGGGVAPSGQPGKPGNPVGPNEPPTLIAATEGSSLYVVAARASGSVDAFGPALPGDASLLDIAQLTVSADNSHVALVLRQKSGPPTVPDTLFVGDGKTWTKVVQSPTDALAFQASEDLGLFVVPTACAGPPSAATRPVILRADGTTVFDGGNCTSGAFVYALAPDDSYFVLQDSSTALTLYPAGPGATGVALSAGGIVGSAFDTSLIVFDTEDPTPSVGRWVDTGGALLSVAGYSASTGTPAGLLDIKGELYALADRKVDAVQPVPSGAQPDEITAVVGKGLVMLQAEGMTSARLVDASGHVVGSYSPGAPLANPAPPGLRVVGGGGAARWLTSSTSWILFQNLYGTVPAGGNGFQTSELSADLWILTNVAGKAVGQTIPLRHIMTANGVADARTYVPSGGGTSVFYLDGGTIHAIDAANGADEALTSSFQATSLATRCDASCVVF